MVAFDASILMLSIQPEARSPVDPTTGGSVPFAAERVEWLLRELEAGRETILIPTPVLAEIPVHAGAAAPLFVTRFQESACFKIADFDLRAAIESAELTRIAMTRPDGKQGGSVGTWAKIKFDRQIIAIARVNGASVLYSDDEDMARAGELAGVRVVGLHQLPLPPANAPDR